MLKIYACFLQRNPVQALLSGFYLLFFLLLSLTLQAQNTLDIIGLTAASPSAGAFSLRKLSTSYAGNCLRVRRSSDNAQQDIGFTASGDLDKTALLAFVGSASGFVVTWYDQSGFARNATQATAAAQPRIVNAGTVDTQNAKPTLVFSGSQTLLTSVTGVQATTSGNITTANFVFSNATVSSSIVSNGDASGTNRYNIHAPYSDGNTYFDIGNGSSGGRISGPLTWTGFSVGSFVRNGSQGDIYKNGINQITSSAFASTVTNTNPIWIGSFDGVSNFVSGVLSEAILFPSALSTINRQALETNQQIYFAVSSGLLLAYEGFDYYNYYDVSVNRNLPLTAPIALHNVCNDPAIGQPRLNVTNSPTSLGWGGDWQVTGGNTAIPGYNVSNNSSVTYATATRELIDAGYYAVGGGAGLVAGRPFQVSTSGSFYVDQSTNFLTNSRSTPTDPTTGISASRIGRDGSILYVGLLLTKNNNDLDPVFVSLHKNALVTNATGGNTIQAGYFGTGSVGTQKWGIRLNGTIYSSTTTIIPGSNTLLVLKIAFNKSSGNIVSLFVNPTSIGGSEPTPDLTAGTAGVDNTVTALAYSGGAVAGASALDEIRVAGFYSSATLASASVSVSGTFGGTGLGANIFANGDFGMVTGSGETVATSSSWTNPSAVTFKNTNAIAPGYSYIIDQNGRPGDGEYSVATGTRNPYGLINGSGPPFWVTSPDRSGTPTGMLGIFNATFQPGKFYETIIPNLCTGTQYEFTVEALNLYSSGIASLYNTAGQTSGYFPQCDPAAEPGCQQYTADAATITALGITSPAVTAGCTPGSGTCKEYSVNPDLEFLIDDIVVYTLPAPVPNDANWHKYGFVFTARPGVSSIKLTLRNKAPGGIGNDIALDNISFRPTGPVTTVSSTFPSCSKPFVKVTLAPNYPTNYFQWQKSTDGGTTWTDLPGATATTNTYTPNFSQVAVGNLIRVAAAGSASSITNANCRIVSNGVVVNCDLPVSWLGFSGRENSGNVDLLWQTSYEKNNDHFDIERSENGTDFVAIGSVKAKGLEKDGKYEYAFTDLNPVQGVNYYRIRQVDYNTESSESNTISVKVSSQAMLKFFPNPAKTELHLIFNQELNDTQSVTVRLLSLSGQVVKTQVSQISAGKREVVLGIQEVGNGMYLAEITAGNTRFVRKIVKAE